MTRHYLTSAALRTDPSARALIRLLNPLQRDQAVDARHRLVWSLLASETSTDQPRDFLWRHDAGKFLILSARPPVDRHNLFELRTTLFEPAITPGHRFRFRLRVNATICRTENREGKRIQSRHDIVRDAVLHPPPAFSALDPATLRDRLAPAVAENWLARTGTQSGFQLISVNDVRYDTLKVFRPEGKPAQFGVLDLDGVIQIEDEDRFNDRLTAGFGRAKAFGYGLMLLMPA